MKSIHLKQILYKLTIFRLIRKQAVLEEGRGKPIVTSMHLDNPALHKPVAAADNGDREMT